MKQLRKIFNIVSAAALFISAAVLEQAGRCADTYPFRYGRDARPLGKHDFAADTLRYSHGCVCVLLGVSACSAVDEYVGAGAGEDYPRGQFRCEGLYLAPVPCLHAASFVRLQFRTGGRSRKGAGHAVLDLRSAPRSYRDSGSRSDSPRDRCGGCSTKGVTLSVKCVNGLVGIGKAYY